MTVVNIISLMSIIFAFGLLNKIFTRLKKGISKVKAECLRHKVENVRCFFKVGLFKPCKYLVIIALIKNCMQLDIGRSDMEWQIFNFGGN